MLNDIKDYLKNNRYINNTDRIKFLCKEGENDYKTISYTIYKKFAKTAYSIITLDVDTVRELVLDIRIENL